MDETDWLTAGASVLGLALVMVGTWILMRSFHASLRLLAMAIVVLMITAFVLRFVVVQNILVPNDCLGLGCEPHLDRLGLLRQGLWLSGVGLAALLVVISAGRWVARLRRGPGQSRARPISR